MFQNVCLFYNLNMCVFDLLHHFADEQRQNFSAWMKICFQGSNSVSLTISNWQHGCSPWTKPPIVLFKWDGCILRCSLKKKERERKRRKWTCWCVGTCKQHGLFRVQFLFLSQHSFSEGGTRSKMLLIKKLTKNYNRYLSAVIMELLNLQESLPTEQVHYPKPQVHCMSKVFCKFNPVVTSIIHL